MRRGRCPKKSWTPRNGSKLRVYSRTLAQAKGDRAPAVRGAAGTFVAAEHVPQLGLVFYHLACLRLSPVAAASGESHRQGEI
jgi:hypothetical protein